MVYGGEASVLQEIFQLIGKCGRADFRKSPIVFKNNRFK
jgi:hypothetical protein